MSDPVGWCWQTAKDPQVISPPSLGRQSSCHPQPCTLRKPAPVGTEHGGLPGEPGLCCCCWLRPSPERETEAAGKDGAQPLPTGTRLSLYASPVALRKGSGAGSHAKTSIKLPSLPHQAVSLIISIKIPFSRPCFGI